VADALAKTDAWRFPQAADGGVVLSVMAVVRIARPALSVTQSGGGTSSGVRDRPARVEQCVASANLPLQCHRFCIVSGVPNSSLFGSIVDRL
jgi:hypothetical protein